MENIRDDIEDQLADADEINNFFADAAKENADELDDELEQMMAEAEMEDIVDVPSNVIHDKIPEKSKQVPAQKVEVTEDEEAELEAMMAL